MTVITIARRARLGRTLEGRIARFRAQLKQARDYHASVVAHVPMSPQDLLFHCSTALTGLVACFESMLSDVCCELVVCFPGKIENKATDLKKICSAGGGTRLVEDMAEEFIARITYDSFPNMMKRAVGLFGDDISLDADLITRGNEIKCTRNLFVHADGIVNSTYLGRTKESARAELGEQLTLDSAYLMAAFDVVEHLGDDFVREAVDRYVEFREAKAFREMWGLSWLSKVVPFEKAWEEESSSMIRPRADFEWSWSSGEAVLFDFFMAIFNRADVQNRDYLLTALRRSPPPSLDGRMIMSWLEAPFFF